MVCALLQVIVRPIDHTKRIFFTHRKEQLDVNAYKHTTFRFYIQVVLQGEKIQGTAFKLHRSHRRNSMLAQNIYSAIRP